MSFLEFIHPDDRAMVAERYQQRLRGEGVPMRYPFRLNPKDGSTKWVEIGAIIIDWDGRPATLNFLTDITERKRAEDALHSRNRALLLISNADSLMMHATEEQTLLDEICKMIIGTGGYRMVWIGFALQDATKSVKPVAQSGFDDGYLETINILWADEKRGKGPTGTAIRTGRYCIARNIRTDPAFIPWRDAAIRHGYQSSIALPLENEGAIFGALNIYSGEPDRFDDDEIALLSQLARDLSFGIHTLRAQVLRRKAEEALVNSEEKYRLIVENSRDIIYILSTTGMFLYVSPSVTQVLGYRPEDLIGQPFTSIIHPDDITSLQKRFARIILEDYETEGIEYRARHFSGEWRWHISRGHAVRDSAGNVLNFTGIANDITERKKTDDELRLTYSRLDSAMEVGKIAWWEMDCVNGAVFFNERKARMLDYPAEQFSHYSDFTRLVYPDDYEPMMQGMRDHLTGIKKMYDVTYRIRKRNGNYLWTQDIGGVSEFAPDGTPLKVTGFVIDVTARKQVEEVLKESEQRFHSMFDRHNSIMLLVDPETGNIADANQAAEQFYGRSKTELCAQSITEINTLSPGEIAAEMNTAARENNNFFIFPHRIASGEIRTVEVHSSPIEVGGKTVLFSIINDITGRKQVEKQINDDYKFLQTLIQTIPNPVFFKDRNGLYTGCNKAFETFLGSSSSELIGKTVYETAPKDVADEYFRMDEELFNNPGTQQYESRIIMKSGQIRHVIFDKATILDINGEVTGIIGVVSDITSRKEAEMLISLMNKKLALLSGITRHDIGNQLSVILGYLDMLKSKLHDPALNEYFKTISRSAKQISRMIQFAKDYELIGVHAPTWQDCRTLVESAAKESALGNVEVKNNIPAGVEVFADPLISKVFYNLVDNAVRYGGKITTIQFLIEESGGDNVIICEDDGEGIPAGEKEMIFMQGYGKHTGIGLAFSRDILSITGTTICETGEPGKGARFEMAVPMGMFR